MKHRKPYQNKRKGTTLTEMVVILAVLAIISTVVVSFSLAVSRRVRVSSAKLEAMQDVEVIEALTESWIDALRAKGAEFQCPTISSDDEKRSGNPDHTKLQATVGNTTYELNYDSATKIFKGTLPDGKSISYTSEVITAIKFSTEPNKVNPGASGLFICTVEYTVPLAGSDTDNEFEYTFCVNPRVGYAETTAVQAEGGTK